MALRYKGKPHRGSNTQVDKVPELCFCEFVAVGFPLRNTHCNVHSSSYYGCDECECTNYRPNTVKLRPTHWPRCVCGHIAQEHNQS